MGNKIVHWELMGPDGEGQAAFYKDVFGWDGQAVEGFNHYYMVGEDHSGLAGAVGQGSDEMPNYFTFYVQVDSIEEHLAAIHAAGGSLVVPRTVVPSTVTFAMFSDPAGNVVGLVEAETPPAG